MHTPESMLAIRVESASRQDSRLEIAWFLLFFILVVPFLYLLQLHLCCGLVCICQVLRCCLYFILLPLVLLVLCTRLCCARKRICLSTCLCVCYVSTIYLFLAALPPYSLASVNNDLSFSRAIVDFFLLFLSLYLLCVSSSLEEFYIVFCCIFWIHTTYKRRWFTFKDTYYDVGVYISTHMYLLLKVCIAYATRYILCNISLNIWAKVLRKIRNSKESENREYEYLTDQQETKVNRQVRKTMHYWALVAADNEMALQIYLW